MAQSGPLSGLAGRAPPRPSVSSAAPTSRWSSSQAERENPRGPTSRKVDEKPKKFVLAKPKNVDPLSNLLGYPDFFQLKADEPEEVLSTVNLANGYCEPNFLADEYGSVKDLVGKKLKEQSFKTNLQTTLASISMARKHFNLRMSNPALTQNKERTAPKRSGESFPRQQAVAQSRAQEFLHQLAGYEPLQKLALAVPHGSKGESLLRSLVEKEVPLLRATWYIKVIYLNVMANDQRKQQQAKPSEDWTRTLTTYVLKSLLASMRSLPDWTRKWHYCLRLLNWNYYEGLLDIETLWTALLASLEIPGVEECCQALVVVQQYIEDLCKSATHLLRLTDACLARMAKIGSAEESIQARLFALLSEVLCYIYLVVPQCSAHFLRERISARIPAAIAALKAPTETEFDAERIDVLQLLSELPEGGRYNVFTLLEELEYFPQRGDLDSIARQLRTHAASSTKAAEFIHVICEWTVTRYRPAHHRKLLSATLIRKYNALLAQDHMALDGEDPAEVAMEQTQARLHVFLDTFDCHANSLEQTELIGLFSELIRSGQFSYELYLRFLIANDILSKQDKRARRHFTYLNHFPIVNENPVELAYQQNQRRIALYGVGTKLKSAGDEYAGQAETVKAEIFNMLAELQRDPLTCGPQHASDPRLPMYYLRPLLASLATHVRERFNTSARQAEPTAAPWIEQLLHVFSLYYTAGDLTHITSLILWFLQTTDIRSLEPLFFSLIRENDMAFASLDLLPELLSALQAKLVQPGIARNLEREYQALLCELCHRFAAVKGVEKWKSESDEKMRTVLKSYDPSKEKTTDFLLGGAPRIGQGAPAPSMDLSQLLAQLREAPNVARLHAFAAQTAPRCSDREISMQIVRDIVRAYLQPFPIAIETKRRTHVLAFTYLLHDLRAQNSSINIDQIFLKHLRDDIINQLTTTRDSLSEQGRGLMCLLFSCVLRGFIRLDHLLLRVLVPLLSAPAPQQSEDGSQQASFALTAILYTFSPNFIAALGVLSQPEIDILSRQQHLSLSLIFSVISGVVQHGMRIPPPAPHQAGEQPQAHAVELDNDSLPFRTLRSVLYNPAVKAACQCDYARLHDELKRLPHSLDRVLIFNLLGHFAPVRTMTMEPAATPGNESEVSPSPLSSESPSSNSPLSFGAAVPVAVLPQRLTPASMVTSLLAWTVREATALRLHEAWFVLRFALENPLNFVELERPPTAMVRLSVSDATRAAVQRPPLVRFLFSELLHRPDAAATYGKLICLLECRDEALSLMGQLLEPDAGAPFSTPLRLLFLAREKSILEELDLSAPSIDSATAEVSAEKEEQLHQALLRLVLPCVFSASMEQRHQLVVSLGRQLSVFLQLCERYERGQLPSRPPLAVAQKHLVLRLRLLVPLTATILKQKNLCKHEDLVLSLFRLLGKRLVQAGEADGTLQWFTQLLDALVNGRDFETTKLAPGNESRLLNRLREELKRMELPLAWRRQITTALPFLLMTQPSFDFVMPTSRLSALPSMAATDGVPATAGEVHMDPWRLLEDYNDTPFTLQSFGGTRVDRASLTYAQLRTVQGAVPPTPEQGAAKRPSEPTVHLDLPHEEAGGDAVMQDRSTAPPQAKAARV